MCGIIIESRRQIQYTFNDLNFAFAHKSDGKKKPFILDYLFEINKCRTAQRSVLFRNKIHLLAFYYLRLICKSNGALPV